MANLRLKSYNVVDSTNLQLQFTEKLNDTIGVNNITITSQTNGLPDATILDTNINGDILNVLTTPLTPYGKYYVKLFSTLNNPFKSVNGNMLFEDGNTNIVLISGAENPDNDQLVALLDFYKNNVYNTNDGLIRTFIDGFADSCYKTKNTINQLKSDKYLDIFVEDEQYIRGAGPFDRLQNEGVFQVIRVGANTKDKTYKKTLYISNFPSDIPVTLQSKSVKNEILTVSNTNAPGTFNEYICTLKNSNIIKINSITVIYTTDINPYVYNINHFGYQLQDAKYDKRASSYITLKNNQFKFSEIATQNGFILPQTGDKVIVTYEYKDTSIFVNEESIIVSEIDQTIREVCPPIINNFSLKHGNIVNSTGQSYVGNIGGVAFYDPQANPPFSKTHPAFQTEVAYNPQSLPTTPGYYSIDYAKGIVYVFGINLGAGLDKGTGVYPPVCSYFYKQEFKNNFDYSYEPNLLELSTNTERELGGKNIIIDFDYSINYIEGVDYNVQAHKEELDERIENNLLNLNTIQTKNHPITNVFRIYNETTGEIYPVQNFYDNKIVFSYNRAPTIIQPKEEQVSFKRIPNENLIPFEWLTDNIVKINLENSNIISKTEDNIASSINSSLSFTNTQLFSTELYFDRTLTLQSNINKLQHLNTYMVDYVNGIVYLYTTKNTINFGTVSYNTKYIETKFKHILTVNNVYSKLKNTNNQLIYTYNKFNDNTVDLEQYEFSDVKYLDSSLTPLSVINNEIHLPQNSNSIRGIYEITDLNTYVGGDGYKPINFATNSIVNYAIGSLVPVNYIEQSKVLSSKTIEISKIKNNENFVLKYVNSIKRVSDNLELYNTPIYDGSFNQYTITLPTDTAAQVGDDIIAECLIELKDGSLIIADIDLGGLYIDYTCLFDEIVISYEYGDNCIDFRNLNNSSIVQGKPYYVSYRYGALRDSLFNNFGSNINIDDFKNFNVDFNRERYREALKACLQNFPTGPTIQSIKNIAKLISHVEPIITESSFQEWVLNLSHLYENKINAKGTLIPSIWDYGIYFESKDDKIEIPISNHIKLNNGTVEFWTVPNWNGIDNDAVLTIKLLRDGLPLSAEHIWIGSADNHPTLNSDGSFSLSRFDTLSPNGMPSSLAINNANNYGVFIYYDIDDNNWKFFAKDNPTT